MTARPFVHKPVVVLDDRVRTEAVEINAVRHCNIRCRSCSHGSPSMRPWFADPEQTGRDLAALTPWLSVEHVRILGGEPLLHPHLVELLRAVRDSGLGARRRLLTNGLGLGDRPVEFWNEVEEVHVSVYPNTARQILRARPVILRAADRSGTTIRFKHFDHFRIAFRRPDDHPELTQDIYATCQIANRWRCITVDAGRLHRCPQSMLSGDAAALAADSLEIADIVATETVSSWLLRDVALLSCRSCTGSVGLRHPHRARRRGDSHMPSDALDLDFLERLRSDGDADNGCVSVEELC